MNRAGEIVEATYGTTSETIPTPVHPQGPQPGADSATFEKNYGDRYKFKPDPYNSLGIIEDDHWMRVDDPDLARFPELTRYSDGSLISHIRYLMSVLVRE